MGCCGGRRVVDPALPARLQRRLGAGAGRPPALRELAAFRYGGKTALTVRGGVTGRRYRFPRPGAVVLVDARDRPSLAPVPNLRQVPVVSRRS